VRDCTHCGDRLRNLIKLLVIGLLGRAERRVPQIAITTSVAVGVLGSLVLALAAGMPIWLTHLAPLSATFDSDAPSKMADGWLLVPLTAKVRFISPSKLVIRDADSGPAADYAPALSIRRRPRVVPVWYGGRDQNPQRAATTALTFSNALRTFYSFIYRPIIENGTRIPARF